MRTLMFAVALALAFSPAAELPAQSRPNGQGFEDAFLMTERARLADKIRRDGDRVDLGREFERLREKHQKVFATPMPENMVADFARVAQEAAALPPIVPEPGAGKPKSPTESSPELYMAHTKVKFLEDIREEGDRFETAKEFAKVAERFERNFGIPLPEVFQNELGRAAEQARTIISEQRAEQRAADPRNQSKTAKTATPPAVLQSPLSTWTRGIRYPDGLPDWFQTRDANHDGQVALYEWERSRIAEFKQWDLNGDGFLEAQEVLRTYRQSTASTAKSTKR